MNHVCTYIDVGLQLQCDNGRSSPPHALPLAKVEQCGTSIFATAKMLGETSPSKSRGLAEIGVVTDDPYRDRHLCPPLLK
jgi:hypothetical protein